MQPPSVLRPQPLDDLPACIDIIAAITRSDPAAVQRTLRAEHARIGTAVGRDIRARGVEPHVMSPALEDFYASTDAFLYETLVWNRCDTKQGLRGRVLSALQRHFPRPTRVLVFGDGLGFDCAALAIAGHEVTYFEVGLKSVAFAREVFRRNGVAVDIRDDLGTIPADSYDAVVCLDVLEHVPDPPGLVAELARRLKFGGLLVTHAPFAYVGPSACTHLRTNVRYSGDVRRMYAPAGLVPVDGTPLWMPIVLEKAAGRARRRFGLLAGISWVLVRPVLRAASAWPALFTMCCEANAVLECRRLVARTGCPKPPGPDVR